MTGRTRKDLQQALNKGKIEPIYFLFGPEAYLRARAADEIANEALRDTLLREFNDSSFSLIRDAVADALAIAEQLPMMSSRRVVRIRDFGRLKETDEEPLLSYLQRPVETTVVIFSADDIDKRKKFGKTLLAGEAYEFQPLKGAELQAWVRSHLKNLNAEIESPAIQRLLEVVSNDLYTLSNELNKLAAAALPSGRITIQLVDELAVRSREHMNWELSDQLIARNRHGALRTLRNLLDDGVEPVLLVGLIAGTYRRMALAKALMSQGAASSEIFSEVRMPPFKQSSYLALLRSLTFREVAQKLQRIAQADLSIKTSKATPRSQVEMLVCELLG